MKHIAAPITMAFITAVIGFYFGLFRTRVDRLAAFRAKLRSHLIEVLEIPETDLVGLYRDRRVSILQECEMIRPHIYCWRRKRFKDACAAYYSAEQTTNDSEHQAFVHTLYPDSVSPPQDKKTLKQRIAQAINELTTAASANWLMC